MIQALQNNSDHLLEIIHEHEKNAQESESQLIDLRSKLFNYQNAASLTSEKETHLQQRLTELKEHCETLEDLMLSQSMEITDPPSVDPQSDLEDSLVDPTSMDVNSLLGLTVLLEEKEATILQLQEELDHLHDEMNELRDDNSMEQRIEALRAKIAECEEDSKQLDSYKQQIESQEQEKKQLTEELDSMKEQLHLKENELAELKEETQKQLAKVEGELSNQLSKLKIDLDKESSDASQLKEIKETLEQQLNEMTAEVSQMKSQLLPCSAEAQFPPGKRRYPPQSSALHRRSPPAQDFHPLRNRPSKDFRQLSRGRPSISSISSFSYTHLLLLAIHYIACIS